MKSFLHNDYNDNEETIDEGFVLKSNMNLLAKKINNNSPEDIENNKSGNTKNNISKKIAQNDFIILKDKDEPKETIKEAIKETIQTDQNDLPLIENVEDNTHITNMNHNNNSNDHNFQLEYNKKKKFSIIERRKKSFLEKNIKETTKPKYLNNEMLKNKQQSKWFNEELNFHKDSEVCFSIHDFKTKNK
jgi:hypothetical protein